MKKYYIMIIFILAGCSINIPYVKKSDVEKQLENLKKEYSDKVSNKEKEISDQKDNVINFQKDQMIGAANAFYGQDTVYKSIATPNRFDLVIHNFGEEGWTALGHIMPSYDAMLKINERLKNDLDETKTSLADLQKSHEKVLSENQKLVDQTTVWKDKLSKSEKEKNDLDQEYKKKIDEKQTELIKIQDKIIVLEKQRSDEAAATRAAKFKIISVLGGLALACIAGAVYSPLAKDKFAIMAAILGACAIGVWYLQPWHVAVFFGVSALLVTIWVLRKLHITDKTSTNVYRAIESIKTKSLENYNKIIKPELDIWQTKYDKNGNLVPDEQAIKHVDETLMNVGDK